MGDSHLTHLSLAQIGGETVRSRGILRRLGILDRDDETFRIRLRSTQQTTTVKGIRLGRGLSRSARTARRGGAVRAPGAGARAAIVKVQYMASQPLIPENLR
jgi:hypothetical protein